MALRQPSNPSPDEIASALEELERHTTDTPRVSDLRTLTRAGITPSVSVGNTTILDWSITEGRPRHGAMRSDSHVSYWKTRFESREECPDCSAHGRVFEYSAHHNIAGYVSETCECCEHTFESEDWG
jgi:hypothetical protein